MHLKGTYIIRPQSKIHDGYENQKTDREQKNWNVPKLELEKVPEIRDHELTDDEAKLNKQIDDIFFNKKFLKKNLDEIELELKKWEEKDPKNHLLIKGTFSKN